MNSSKLFLQRVLALYDQSDEVNPVDELRVMVECFLGSDYDREKLEQLIQEQRGLHAEIDKIADTRAGRSGARRADQINVVIQSAMARCMSILGKRDFHKLFGGNASPRLRLVDPTVMARRADEAQSQRPVMARRPASKAPTVKRPRVTKGRQSGSGRIKVTAKSTKIYGKLVPVKKVVRRKAARKKR